ncbi:MAG TPA: hypothetical protein VNZ86_19940 [Bacteroidia bacterium]|jgi:hypothetical protein|nr:hypothetical protein [Bacteroidia bacterium]
MKNKIKKGSPEATGNKEKNVQNAKDYPLYPATEDIYAQAKEEKDLDPENISKTKQPNEIPDTRNEKDFMSDITGEDLDIPGNEEDEKEENEGHEDEENNYYSLGGDGHADLDEPKG